MTWVSERVSEWVQAKGSAQVLSCMFKCTETHTFYCMGITSPQLMVPGADRLVKLAEVWLLFTMNNAKDILFAMLCSLPGQWLPTWVPRCRLAKCTSGIKRTGWVSRSRKGLNTVMSIRLCEGSSGTLTSGTERNKMRTLTSADGIHSWKQPQSRSYQV